MSGKLLNFIQHPLVLFFLAWVVSYLFYRLQKNHRRLSYQNGDTIVIDPKASQSEDRLEVRYGGEIVPQVTRTTVRFWNSGTEAIRGSDVSSADPLRWKLPENAQILSLALQTVTREPIRATVEQDGSEVKISFDFLEPSDGAVFSVLHTGDTNKSAMKGTVIGLKDRIVWWGDVSTTPPDFVPPSSRTKKKKKIGKWVLGAFFVFAVLSAIFGLLTLVSGMYPNFFLDNFPDWFNKESSWTDLVRDQVNYARFLIGLAMTAFFGLITAALFVTWRTRPPMRLRIQNSA